MGIVFLPVILFKVLSFPSCDFVKVKVKVKVATASL